MVPLQELWPSRGERCGGAPTWGKSPCWPCSLPFSRRRAVWAESGDHATGNRDPRCRVLGGSGHDQQVALWDHPVSPSAGR